MSLPTVSVGIITWNGADDIVACIGAVRAQRHPHVELLVGDNASTDATREHLRELLHPSEYVFFDRNLGFAGGHNALMARTRGDYYLCLNPDAVLNPGYVEEIVREMEVHREAGAATGKLLRREHPGRIDSTGIVMTPNQRHLDRGADEPDDGRFSRVESVFGASGAAAVYRRLMLEDVKFDEEYFDPDFFAYREDADLAWRAQLFGWTCLYVPAAVALHGRRVTPERRSEIRPEYNRYSVRNRFLLRIKNQPFGHVVRFFVPATIRDLQVIGYVLLREWSSIPGLLDVVRLLPRTWAKRRFIMRRRSLSTEALSRWFAGPPGR